MWKSERSLETFRKESKTKSRANRGKRYMFDNSKQRKKTFDNCKIILWGRFLIQFCVKK